MPDAVFGVSGMARGVRSTPLTGRSGRWAAVAAAAGVVLALSYTSYFTGVLELTSSTTVRAAVVLTAPILLAGLGGLWSERAGVVNLGLEGMMVLGTWGGAWGAYHWGPWAGLGCAAVFGALGGLVHAVATVGFGVNHIVSGVAINLLGPGVAKYLATLVFEPVSHNQRESAPVPKLPQLSLPWLPQWLADLEDGRRVVISDVAGIVRGLVSEVSPIAVLAAVLAPLTWWVLWRTRVGLRLRSTGENPVAAESLGIGVYRYKYAAVVFSGLLAGLGGAALVLNPGQPGYLEGQTGGRGYLGLAAMIFGNWRPGGVLSGSALFGYADGLRLSSGGGAVYALLYAVVWLVVAVAAWRLVGRRLVAAAVAAAGAAALYCLYWFTDTLPSELTDYLPQIVTLAVLALGTRTLRPPAADGFVYRRGRPLEAT
ncbi:MAG: ABC transporter permease [Mycobacteriaceae bacterium]|nr:ABC transporter permease [Mycobacteriaceae bacterium]